MAKKAALKPWVKGLAAAVISSIASGIVVVIVDPITYQGEWEKLAKISAALGIWGAAMYLKQSPVPGNDGKL